MKSLSYFQLGVLLLFELLISGCENNRNRFAPEISIEKNKITCKFCTNFGDEIVADEEFIMIAAYTDVYIFKYNIQTIELIQKIGINQGSGIQSMSLNSTTLAIGAADDIGTGKVFIYEKMNNSWNKKQELAAGRNADNFGSDIDIDGDFMVVGASADWGDWSGISSNEGRIYIFEKNSDGWIQKHEFLAKDSKPNDRFGMTIALQNDFVIAGSWTSLLHIYKKTNDWELLRSDSILARGIAHYGDNFMIYTESPQRQLILISIILQPNGSFKSIPVDCNFEGKEISDHGEIFVIKNNYALIDLESDDKCFLLEFLNDKWVYKTSFIPDLGESCTFYGLEVTDNYIIVGGRDDKVSGYSYVYLREY